MRPDTGHSAASNRLTGESWQTAADEAGGLFVAEDVSPEFGQRPVVQDVRALEALTAVVTGPRATLIHVQLAVLSLVTWTEAPIKGHKDSHGHRYRARCASPSQCVLGKANNPKMLPYLYLWC